MKKVNESLSKNVIPVVKRGIAELALNSAIAAHRMDSEGKTPWAIDLAIALSTQHLSCLKTTDKQVLLLKMADLHKFKGDKAAARKCLQAVIDIGGDKVLRREARRGLTELDQNRVRMLRKGRKVAAGAVPVLLNEIKGRN